MKNIKCLIYEEKNRIRYKRKIGNRKKKERTDLKNGFLLSLFTLLVMTFLFTIPVKAASTDGVAENGQLKVIGTKLCNQNDKPVQLKGMSYFWHNWDPGLYNASTVAELATNWDACVVRVPMGIDVAGGYLADPTGSVNKISTVIDAAINQGIYVIIDWHEEKATTHTAQAMSFFATMAQKYGNNPNVIYEIYNEPTSTSWSEIKNYAQQVIGAIRQYDPDNIIIVGTPDWSQDVDAAANDPIGGTNIMYTLHFYAGTHKQSLRDKATYAINKGIALFVTEWGTCDASGNGNLDLNESNTWLDFLNSNKISWCNWSLNTKAETASALIPSANLTGPWSDAELTESGRFVKSKLTSTVIPDPNSGGSTDPNNGGNTDPSTGGSTEITTPEGVVSGATYEITNVDSKKALSAIGTTDGANVEQLTYQGDNLQKWVITDQGAGMYEISSLSSGKALDIAGNWNGANVQILKYSGENYQKWYLNNMGNGQYRIINAGSYEALHGDGSWDGANVEQLYYMGTTNQHWTLTRIQ